MHYKLHTHRCSLFIFLFTILSPSFLNAQTIKVVDESNKAIIGASAYTKDLAFATLSNEDGILNLESFPDTSKVIISFYGFDPVNIDLKKSFPKRIQLKSVNFLFDEFVVLGNDKRPLSQQIRQIDILKPQTIGSFQAQTSADLLENSGQVFVQKSQMGGGSPIIRGFEASRILLVVDDVKLNNAIYRSGHLQNSITISPLALDQAEIIQGPASLLYGSDALGGVVHYKTRKPTLLKDKQSKGYSGSLVTSYNNANNGTVISSLNEIRGKKLSSLSIISVSNFESLKTGKNGINEVPDSWRRFYYQDFLNGRDTILNNQQNDKLGSDQSYILEGTDYQQLDILQKLLYVPNNKLEIGFNVQYSQSSDIPRYDQLSEKDGALFKFAEWYYGPQIRGLAALKIHYKKPSKLFDESRITLAYQKLEESRIKRKYNDGNRVHNIENLDVWSANWVFQKKIGSNLKQSLFYGLDAQFNKLQSGGFTENIFGQEAEVFFSRYPSGKASSNNAGVYANYLLKSQSGNRQLNIGIRSSAHFTNLIFENTSTFNWPTNYTDGSLKINNQALIGSVAFKQKLKSGSQINFSLSNAFRAPNIDDLGKIRIKGNFVNIPNPTILPEKAYTADLGFSTTFNGLTFNTNLYYTMVRDLLVRQSSDETVIPGYTSLVNTNASNGFISGLNGQVDWQINKEIEISYTAGLTKGRYNYLDNDLNIDTLVAMGHIPPLYGVGRIQWTRNQFEFALVHRFNGIKRLEDYEVLTISRDTEGNNFIQREGSSDNIEYGFVEFEDGESIYRDLPSWNTFNIYVSWKTEHQRVFLSLENIFDKHYRTFSSGLSAAGRNIGLGLIFNY